MVFREEYMITQEEAELRMKNLNLILLGDYIHSQVKVKIQCFCGNIFYCLPNSVFQGVTTSCGCYRKKIQHDSKSEKIGKRYGKVIVLELSQSINWKTRYKCICDCGVTFITYADYLQHGKVKTCGKCGYNDLSGQKFGRLMVISVAEHKRRLKYNCVCDCGKNVVVKAYHLTSGKTKSCGCLKVDLEKKRNGKNHPRYNPDISDEERRQKRKTPEYKNWTKNILKRDCFACQICGERGGKLRAHHIDGFNWRISKRIDLSNGVALCKQCHDDFHKEYGYGYVTRDMYIEYMENYNAN